MRFSTMTARERMLAAFDRQPVDRIPTFLSGTSEVWTKLKQHFGTDDGAQIERHLGLDDTRSIGAEYIGPSLAPLLTGETVDMWGIRRIKVLHSGGTYDEQSFHPLAYVRTMDDLKSYTWPSTAWFSYDTMRAKAEAARQTHAVACGYMAPFYYYNMLRGLEQSLVDPYEDPELAHAIITGISDTFLALHRAMFEACPGLIDVCQVTDDLGSQTGPMISLETYRAFYAPHHRRMIALCREFGIRVMHHDCGSCRVFLPDLVDMGIDILDPIQHRTPGMDRTGLKAAFGDRLCFHGGIENQQIMPFGSEEDVRAEVRACLDTLAADGTGYVLGPCHNLQGHTPLRNILALYDEAQHTCWR